MKTGFEKWLEKVEEKLNEKWGCSADDLPDWDYWNAYEDGDSPSQAVAKVVKNAMGY